MNRNFVRMSASHFLGNLGDGMTIILIPLMVLAYYEQPEMIGIASSTRMAPWFLFSILIGYYIDQSRRVPLAVGSNLTRGILFILLSAMYFITEGNFYILLLALFVIGICEVIADSTITVLTPQIVEDKKLEKANFWITQSETVGNQFAGPSLASFFAATISYVFSMAFIGTLYIIAAGAFPKIPEKKVDKKEKFNFKLFWTPFQQNKNFILLALLAFFWNFTFSADILNALFFIKEQFNINEAYYGLAVALSALGAALCGPFFLKWLIGFSLKVQLLTAGILYLVSLILRGLVIDVYIFFSLFILIGTGQIILNVASVTYRQRAVEYKNLAKVNGVIRTIGLAGLSFGPLMAGYTIGLVSTTEFQLIIAACFSPFIFLCLLLKKLEKAK